MPCRPFGPGARRKRPGATLLNFPAMVTAHPAGSAPLATPGVSLLFDLTWPPAQTIGSGMKRPSAVFKLSKQQLAERTALAADLREKAKVLNAAIAAFNQAIEPLSRAVVEAQDDYNTTLEKVRALANGVTETAHDEFDARSERWRESDKGIQVRGWIEQWEMSLDDIDLEVPEPLTEVDPEEQALEIEGAPPVPTE
jgi:uncharacterized coiled-coil protein SlyX